MTENREIQLGRQVEAPSSPQGARLDLVPNPAPDRYYAVRFTCPEFTSLCPVTGQPDFATVVIDYVPRVDLVESKSLKLFLHSFRNHRAFHEACTDEIGQRIYSLADPHWLRVCAFFYPRGGIPIDVFWCRGRRLAGIYIPDPGVPPYRAR